MRSHARTDHILSTHGGNLPRPADRDALRVEADEKRAAIEPMQRPGEPGEVAAAVMFLVSDVAAYVSGANLAVGGAR